MTVFDANTSLSDMGLFLRAIAAGGSIAFISTKKAAGVPVVVLRQMRTP